MNETTNHRKRTLNYKVPYESAFIGKGTICTYENQVSDNLIHRLLSIEETLTHK
jgi:hypothetical protein